MNYSETFEQEIAIIGMAGRFPGAKSVDEFWRNLRDGVGSISFFSQEELAAAGIDSALLSEPNYVRAYGLLEDAPSFDASFFGFSPREAEIMDPQHRLLLQCAWECLENAGYDSEKYDGRIAVYAGASLNSYLLSNLLSNPDLMKSVGNFQAFLANDKDHLPLRISYKLNLRGPSVLVQTACSTSLVAVHMACQSLLSGECDMALAGGVSVRSPQKTGYLYHEDSIASPDGHCRAFDAKAQGTVSGSGVGLITLKRLADALAARDTVQAVIKGSAINNDGSSKVGYTAPSINGQSEVISEAMTMAEVDPETITYIEAHGTGTPLGDPIEVAALTQAFRARTQKQVFCAIGSVKTNIGHLDAAAGIAGLIKTVLALKHKMIPPSLHYHEPNPKIDFTNSPFYVNAQLSPWERAQSPRRAGVSSFGMGGTNAHIVLEEAPAQSPCEESRPWQLLTLSAKTRAALDAATSALAEYLRQNDEASLADIAYTYNVGRRDLDHRRVLVCHDFEDARAALQAVERKRVHTGSGLRIKERPIAFMFTGQGSQYINMAFDLYMAEPFFRQQVDLCSVLLKPHLGIDLRHLLYPADGSAEEAAQQLNQTSVAQPALFVIEYALARLWMHWGVCPQAMIGHSSGEYVAACLSDVLSLEDALSLVAARGQLMQSMKRGAMLSVALPEEEARLLLGEHLSLAAINSPSLCVLSGPTAAIEETEARLSAREVTHRRLHTSHAFHSQLMDPALSLFAARVQSISFNSPTIPFISNLTGTWITASQAMNPNYWVKHLRHTVRFAEGVEELLKEPDRILLEVGPGNGLSTLAKQQTPPADERVILSSLRHPHEQKSDHAFILESLGKLWLTGARINWQSFYAEEKRRRVPVPTYPFTRQHYWVEPQRSKKEGSGDVSQLGKKPDLADWFYVPSWKRSPLPDSACAKDLLAEKRRWLVFRDEQGLGSEVVSRLEQTGQDVITVIEGEAFARLDLRRYRINPRRREDFEALIAALTSSNEMPADIVYLWNLTVSAVALPAIELQDKRHPVAFDSLLFLAQAMGNQNVSDDIRVSVVTSNMWEIIGDDLSDPSQALVLGPCRVIPQEYANMTCRSIDVGLAEPSAFPASRVADHLLAELLAVTSDQVVAYRGKHRWVETFEAVRLNHADQKPARLRERGIYLITGGMGGIGFALAQYLAQTVQAKLVLLGRSAFPEPHEWAIWLATHEPDNEISQKIKLINQLEALGAEVMIASADVCDRQQMREVINRVEARWGQVNGVIHAAGIPGGRLIQLRTQEESESVLAPKVQGTLVLDEVFKYTNLDFLVLCSSMGAILGGPAEADYCAANAFMDAFAHYSNSRNARRTISINWGVWQEVGMAARLSGQAAINARYAESLKKGMLVAEGIDAFSRVLASDLSQVIVSTQHLPALIAHRRVSMAALADQGAEKVFSSAPAHDRLSLTSTYTAPTSELEKNLVEIWQELLGLAEVGIDDNFFELGGHSLLATVFTSRLRKRLQVSLPLHTIFSAPTIAELALVIEEILIAEIEEMDQVQKSHYAG